MSGMLTVFFFARLWRRAGVMTDVELTEIRYRGRPAAFLRGFRALYLSLPVNCIVMGQVNLAMVKILAMVFGQTTIGLGLLALAAAAGGLIYRDLSRRAGRASSTDGLSRGAGAREFRRRR